MKYKNTANNNKLHVPLSQMQHHPQIQTFSTQFSEVEMKLQIMQRIGHDLTHSIKKGKKNIRETQHLNNLFKLG